MLKDIFDIVASVWRPIKEILSAAYKLTMIVVFGSCLIFVFYLTGEWAQRNHKQLDTPGEWLDAAFIVTKALVKEKMDEDRKHYCDQQSAAGPALPNEQVITMPKTQQKAF